MVGYRNYCSQRIDMKVSEYKVMKSPAGHYIGREYDEKEMKGWVPYSRNRDYFKTDELAQSFLEEANPMYITDFDGEVKIVWEQ